HFPDRRRDFWRAALAQSGLDTSHLDWRNGNGLAFRARTQHSPPHLISGDSWHAGVVGISRRVASRHARGTRFLSLSPAMTLDKTGANKLRWAWAFAGDSTPCFDRRLPFASFIQTPGITSSHFGQAPFLM